MKCINHHPADAVAVCCYCGRGLCPACIPDPTARRLVCSSECQAALERGERALQLLLEKSVHSARASAFYYYLCGGLLTAAAVGAWFMLPSPFLIYFTAACALVCVAAGFWHGRGSRKTV